MEQIKYNEILDETIYINELSSGIKCYIIPRKGFMEKQGVITTKYGSVDNNFQSEGSVNEMPEGIAHFLEHKLFEEEDMNVFDRFVNQGANVNAFTNFTNTAYYFNCIDNFDTNLKLLLQFTQSPYFTDENVEKEKGIIAQEINMYNDEPGWKMYIGMLKAMYFHCPAKKDIAGTIESIGKINKDMLYHCYNTFYYPKNMAIICVGDVKPERVYELSEKLITKKNANDIKRLYGYEPANVVTSITEGRMPLSRTMFNLGFKDSNFEESTAARITAAKLAADIIAGESSHIYGKMYNEGLIDGSFAMDYIGGDFFGASVFTGASNEPEIVTDIILQEIKRLKTDGINHERFENIKRKHIGRFIKAFDSIDSIATAQTDLFSKGIDLIDIMESYTSITIESIEQRINELFRDGGHTLSIVRPV